MIKKASDVKLNVLPLLISVEHLYYYEGPCRFGKGDALQPGYDRLANAQKQEQFLGLLKDHLPEGCELMDPVTLSRTDDWENPEAQWDAIAPAVAACDIIVAQTGIACDDRVLECAERFGKPITVSPLSGFSGTIAVAGITSKPGNYEVFACYKWDDLKYRLKILRARKVIRFSASPASAPPPPTAPWTRSTAMSISPIVWAFASGLSTSMRCSTR